MTTTSLNRNTSKPRSALRLISTKELPREEWLDAAPVRLAAAGVWMTLAFLLLFLAQRRKTRRIDAAEPWQPNLLCRPNGTRWYGHGRGAAGCQ